MGEVCFWIESITFRGFYFLACFELLRPSLPCIFSPEARQPFKQRKYPQEKKAPTTAISRLSKEGDLAKYLLFLAHSHVLVLDKVCDGIECIRFYGSFVVAAKISHLGQNVMSTFIYFPKTSHMLSQTATPLFVRDLHTCFFFIG